MKTLYIVRHAKSSWDHPHLTDIERPLNKRGKKDAPEMARRLLNRGIFPDLIMSSPASRALVTCQTIAEKLNYPQEAIAVNDNLYHAGENALLRIVKATDNNFSSLMLFGHNPGLTGFANNLSHSSVDNIPTCGVFAFTFAIDQWDATDYGKGKLLFYDYPNLG